MSEIAKRCYRCGEKKLEEAFGKNATKKDGLQDECRSCQAAHQNDHLLWAINLLGGCCTHPGCGQIFIPGLHMGDHRHLEFHHLIPEGKLFHILSSISRSKAVLRPELMKCVLLCREHHRAIHFPNEVPDTNDIFDFNPPTIKETSNDDSMGQQEHPALPRGFVPQQWLLPYPDVRADQP